VPLADWALAAGVVSERQQSVAKNTSTSPSDEFMTLMKGCIQHRPAELIMSDLNWKFLVRSTVRGKNIMIVGPQGCGKTLAVQSTAKYLSNRQFFYFNLGATTDARSTLIGNTHFSKDTGTFVSEALFVKAISTPGAIILLDELSRATPEAWNILMTALDENQRYVRIDEHPDTPTVKVAKGVTFMATANIGGEFTATRVLDRALIDRFTCIIEMQPLSVSDEIKMLCREFKNVSANLISAVANIAGTTREQVKKEDPRVSTILSGRSTKEIVSLLEDGFTLEEAAEVAIYPYFSDAGGVDSERTYMRQVVQQYLGTSTNSLPWNVGTNNTQSIK
jgi:MoxR-like ATPase